MNRKLLNLIHTRRGLALVSVLAMVTLATVIVLALFSVSDTEFKASKVYAGGNAARHLSDTAVNIVMGQIRSATYNSTNPSEIRIWASQPGAVRVYGPNGSFSKGYKLYSDEKMIVETAGAGGEAAMTGDVPDSAWNNAPDQYVDLNEPVIRAESGGVTRVFFPIADPRSAYDDPSTRAIEKVEGFSYSSRSSTSSGGTIAGVVEPGRGGGVNALRLPMPVEWLYVLKDGSVGTVGQNGKWANGPAPDDDNPIIGRVAFWTDDESCRVNINTASEPGYWAVPTFFHDRDKGWSDSPPVLNEYQRFPGHPATVALSTILYPSSTSVPKFVDAYPSASLMASSAPPSESALAIKERIYQIIPKINGGGTMDGTLAFAGEGNPQGTVDESKNASVVDLQTSRTERLYTSLDELMFAEKMSNNRRVENDFQVAGTTLLQAGTLEKSRFFMTAHSRSPELNLFGRPRVAMWPVPDVSLGAGYRTGYDVAIASAATLAPNTTSTNTYYFSRRNADSALEDIGDDAGGAQGLLRNKNLMIYLDQMMKKTFPGGASFAAKYGGNPHSDYRQILVEIFDYIRSTNLYDSFLAPKFTPDKDDSVMDYREGTGATTPKSLAEAMIWKEIPDKTRYKTYTEPRFKVEKTRWYPTGNVKEGDTVDEIVASGVYPGHGQVTPAEWSIDGQTYKGFGRFPTISEVGLQFICTADGIMQNPDGSWDSGAYVVVDDNGNETRSGGRTAEKIDPSIENPQDNPGYRVGQMTRDLLTGEPVHEYWYSNYPPFPSKRTLESYGCVFADPAPGNSDPQLHPGAQPENWNATLDRDVPLTNNEKRIQVALMVEFFVPSVGWTKYAPEFTLVLDPKQLSAIKVKDSQGKMTPLFSTTDPNVVIRSNMSFMSNRTDGLDQHYGIYPLGSTSSPRSITHGRQVKGVGQVPDDPGFNGTATDDEHFGVGNFTLVSSFVTIRRDQSLTLEGAGSNGLTLKLYADHNWEGKDAVQTIKVPIPNIDAASDVPPPELVRYSTQKLKWEDANGAIYTQRAVDACRWWAFNWGGALRRWTGSGLYTPSGFDWNVPTLQVASPSADDGVRTRGRFEGQSHGSVTIDDSAVNGIKGRVAAGSLFYGYTVGGGYEGVKSRSRDRGKRDLYRVVSDRGPDQMGEYGFYGSDTVRSVIPKYGDYRLIAAKKVVGTEMWTKHRLWDQPVFFAHNFSSFFSNTEAGFDKGGANDEISSSKHRLIAFKQTDSTQALYDDYKVQFVPDMPCTEEAGDAAKRYGDFDNGPGTCRDGAYINKPDEGNLSVVNMYWLKEERRVRNAYFQDQWMQLPASESYFTPNRMISSPGMLGSLPTGVFGSMSRLAKGSDSALHGEPWRTLLFRPQLNHPGGPAHATGGVNPADHYIMDLFWMPIVEPYAISESWSSAGKINMNFQIVPFSYINRATGMYAALKGELVTAIPTADARIRNVKQRQGAAQEKSYKEYMDVSEYPPLFFNESGGTLSNPGKFWHRYINLEATTSIMKRRMDIRDAADDQLKKGLFRTASQICEVPLVPVSVSGASNPGDMNDYENSMASFWRENALTGDNTRERPYANLYQKLTTRSNTFRVFFRAQSLKKARSLGSDQVVTVSINGGATDSVVAEYRGSALIERYLDMTATLPNYADGADPFVGNKTTLDAFYRYRVLESKQFAP